MLLDFSLITVFIIVDWRLISYNVSSTFWIPCRQSIKTLSKAIARNHSSLLIFLSVEVIKHEVQVCTIHLLKMIYNVFVSIHLNLKMLLNICWTLSWKFIMCCKSRGMLKFRCILFDFLRSPLRSEIKYGRDSSSFRDWMMLFNLSSWLRLSFIDNLIWPSCYRAK